MGLVFISILENGIGILGDYGFLILVLVGMMLFVVFVVNLIIVFVMMCKNFYFLVLWCLKDLGIIVFFICSFVVNIFVNMRLCEDLGLDKDIYLVFILFGVVINMVGVVIIINILILVVVNILGIIVDFLIVFLLSVVVVVLVCGVFGVIGGLFLLILVVCSLFGILNDVVM